MLYYLMVGLFCCLMFFQLIAIESKINDIISIQIDSNVRIISLLQNSYRLLAEQDCRELGGTLLKDKCVANIK